MEATFTSIFITAVVTATAVQLWLAARQLRHVHEHAQAVPAQFEGRITQSQHAKAAAYTIARVQLGICDLLLAAVLVFVWTLGGALQALSDLWSPYLENPVAHGVALMMSVFLISALLSIPTEIYGTYGIERRFGFNRTQPATYALDTVKKLALMLLIGVPVAGIILWLMQHLGSFWWLAAWMVWIAVNLLAVWAFPVFIAPLFNKFEPLADAELATRIGALLERHGFAANGIFVADGSKRSGHGNAYFTGLGASKRIVFYDTLLDELNTDEVEAVLAHEVGHFKRKHIAKQLLFSAIVVLCGLALLAWLAIQPWFYTGLGVTAPNMAIALLLFMFCAPSFFFFLGPMMSMMSRKHEYEADAFAAEQADGATLVDALVKLYRSNSSTLTPDHLYSAFHDSHPPAPLRIAHLEGLARS
jgi:STE24 endopeptidase